MTELAFISLKTMDGKPCGFARLSGGLAEIRLLEPLAGQAAVLTDGGVFSGAAGSRIAFSGRVLAVALHRDGRLLCMGLPRGAAITPDRIRAQLIPELTPTPYHPPREAQAEPVRESTEKRAEPVRESTEKRAEPVRESTEKRAEPVRESAEKRAEPMCESGGRQAEPVRESAEKRAEPVLAGAATRGRVEQGTPSVPPATAQAAQAQTGSASAAQRASWATEQAGMPVRGSVEPAAVEAKSEPVRETAERRVEPMREPADPPAQPTLAGQEKADPSMSASRREAQRTAEPMRADAEPAPKEEAARAVKAARQPQAEMDGGASGQSPGTAAQTAAAGRSENSVPNAQETAADTESFMALLRRADRAFAAVMHREPPAIPPAAQTGGMRRSARYEAAAAPHTMPRSERADMGILGQAGLDGASRETYAPRATPRLERVDAGMAGQAGLDGASRETYAPHATPRLERADAGMTGQAGLDGAIQETYAPHTSPHSERADAGMADRDTPDGAATAVQGTPLLNGRRLYTGLHGAAGEWCEEVERLLDNAPSDNPGEPIANPFPNIFPGAKFLRIRKPGVPTYLRGDWRSGHGAAGERMRITAVPGAYSPHPPAHLTGFTRYIRARSGGYWIRVEEWNEP